jgi:chromosome segregation ATPase
MAETMVSKLAKLRLDRALEEVREHGRQIEDTKERADSVAQVIANMQSQLGKLEGDVQRQEAKLQDIERRLAAAGL